MWSTVAYNMQDFQVKICKNTWPYAPKMCCLDGEIQRESSLQILKMFAFYFGMPK